MEHKYIEIEGNRVHYLETGKGKPLIMLPSFGLTSRIYSPLGKSLNKEYHVFIPDLCRGKSDYVKNASSFEEYADMLNEFVCKLGIKNFFLIGFSFSGVIAFEYSKKYPFKLNRLMLVSITILPFRRGLFSLFMSFVKIIFHTLLSLNGKSIFFWLMDGIINFFRHPRQFFLDCLMSRRIYKKKVKEMKVSTKLLFAKKDEFLSYSLAKEMSQTKNLSIELIEEGHAWFFFDKKKLVDKINKFFK
jgi:pimeloyl-ACP methyl ester carboxylesterase